MRGRPIKKYDDGKAPVHTSIRLPEDVRELLKENNINLTQEITDYCYAKYGNKSLAELNKLKKKESELESSLIIVRSQIKKIEDKFEEIKRVEALSQQNKKFAIFLVKYYINQAIKGRVRDEKGRIRIDSLIPKSIFEGMGIELDYSKLQYDLLRNGDIPEQDDDLIKHYDVRFNFTDKDTFKYLRDERLGEFLELQEVSK